VLALVGLAQHPEALGKVYNIGSSEEVCIRDLAAQAKQVTERSTSDIALIPYNEAYALNFEDMQRRVPDTSRINALLGWRPRFLLKQILVRVRDSIQQAEPQDALTAENRSAR